MAWTEAQKREWEQTTQRFVDEHGMTRWTAEEAAMIELGLWGGDTAGLEAETKGLELKYNTAHDAHGRFGSTGGGHSGGTAPAGTWKDFFLSKASTAAKGHILKSKYATPTAAEHQAVIDGVSSKITSDPQRMKTLGVSDEAGVKKRVASAIGAWGQSSTSSVHSLAMQHAVAEEFGAKRSLDNLNAAVGKQYEHELAQKIEHEGAANRVIVRAMYEHTQEVLKGEGVEQVLLHRGMHFAEGNAPKWANYGHRDNVSLNPLNSFSGSAHTAIHFSGSTGNGRIARVVSTTVPRERIFSTARTGLGVLSEHEFVVLGTGKTPAKITNVTDEVKRETDKDVMGKYS